MAKYSEPKQVEEDREYVASTFRSRIPPLGMSGQERQAELIELWLSTFPVLRLLVQFSMLQAPCPQPQIIFIAPS